MSSSILNTNIFYLPQGISNVNYQLIDSTYNKYKNILDFLQQYDWFKNDSDKFLDNLKKLSKNLSEHEVLTDSDQSQDQSRDQHQDPCQYQHQDQILESPENNTKYNRLIPPYNANCSNLEYGCVKKAAFKYISDGKLYCWFHVNCQNSN